MELYAEKERNNFEYRRLEVELNQIMNEWKENEAAIVEVTTTKTAKYEAKAESLNNELNAIRHR